MSVAWIVPTVANLYNGLAAQAIESFRTKALASGQADPFDEAMESVCSRIRAEIANKQVISLTEHSIPPSVLWVAKLLITEQMQGRLPGVKLTEEQQEMLRDARDYLKRINKGDIQVEMPDDPVTEETFQTGSAIEVVTSTTRVATRALMTGL